MNARRARFIEEMGLGPLWTLRRRSAEAGESEATAIAVDASRAAMLAERPKAAAPVPNASVDRGDRVERLGRMDWPALKAAVADCRACALAKSRTQAVFGVGDEGAEWLLVGEAPGAEEDARGEPFVGQAGRLLDNMLASIGLKRGTNVYIANVLKCRPPGNRNPGADEVVQCSPHLARQIELIKPRLIIAMGRFAAQTLLDTDAAIARLRGKLHRYRGVPLLVSYHPAYLLRSLPDKAKAWEDLCLARRVMADLKAADNPGAVARD